MRVRHVPAPAPRGGYGSRLARGATALAAGAALVLASAPGAAAQEGAAPVPGTAFTWQDTGAGGAGG